MKRIIGLLLTLCCVLALCACGSSSKLPFDKLEDNPDYSEVLKRYGDGGSKGMNGFGWIQLKYTYPWHDSVGELKITYSANYGDNLSIEGHQLENASWEYSGHDLTKTRDAIVSDLESKNGKATVSTEKYANGRQIVTRYVWKENDYTHYTLKYTTYEGVDTVECIFYPKKAS